MYEPSHNRVYKGMQKQMNRHDQGEGTGEQSGAPDQTRITPMGKLVPKETMGPIQQNWRINQLSIKHITRGRSRQAEKMDA